MSKRPKNEELFAERTYVAGLYERLDAARRAASAALTASLPASSTLETAWQRDVEVAHNRARLARTRIADAGLCFGRIDDADGPGYIGRIGLFDSDNEYEPLLLDWRAPAARPFYCATGANPEGLLRRRHFRTSGRLIEDFQDEVFDGVGEEEPGGASTALMDALNAPRESVMRDIVTTIQAEQDEIIRLERPGVLVVEGGPGTGKTAVALHRVAYLLYTRRERLSRRGALVLGPNPEFLSYIGQVLPSLGESGVVFATTGELFPGVYTEMEDSPAAQRVKGGAEMVQVLAAAVADRQELPDEPIGIELSDVTVPLDRGMAARVRERARASGLPHNPARRVFREELVDELVERAVELIGEGWLDAGDVGLRADFAADVRYELSAHAGLRDVLDRLWPLLTPQRLLAELFCAPQRLAAACGVLSTSDRDALLRADGSAWTVADVALLDESVEFLGTFPRDAQERRARRSREHDAERVLSTLDYDDDDGETLRAADVLDAAELAERYEKRDERPLAERAAADRDWTYGHVVADEAQELSAMDWRLLMRRCPSKEFTVVGDLAQRRSPAGAHSWSEVFEPHVRDRWTYRELRTNYRTPAEIMDVAGRVLAAHDPALRPPTSVRRTGVLPWARRVPAGELAAAVLAVAADEAARTGTFAVLSEADLDLPPDVPILAPAAAKGREFDSVLLVEPELIRRGPCGGAQLYVALTRATQRLGIVHTEPLSADLVEGVRAAVPSRPV
uniref:helicase n=1 Tax=Saccharopolyspora galaxeae TaxID=2781241 RepID=UPI001F2E882E|nr:helicase [Saccharopolyspora sp. HNM0986]